MSKNNRGRCIAWTWAALHVTAICPQAGASDLAMPELALVTKIGVQGALGADINLASRQRLAGMNSTPMLVSTVVQSGEANQVSLTQGGTSNTFSASQQGAFNTVTANQEGQSNSLEVSQQGNNNLANFSQPGGVRASVIQTGDAHKAEVYQTAASPNIVIRQSGIATVVQTTQY